MSAENGTAEWEQKLTGRLEVFVDTWKAFQGTEQAGAQDFLKNLLEIYDVSHRPGTVFEQHSVRMPARAGRAAQQNLFGEAEPQYTTERMDMYLPRVCVWEMKAPSERDLGKYHEQILRYWAHVRTRYMVLCNFHEFLIYDTEEEGGQLAPRVTFTLRELPARADALRFLRGELPDLDVRSEQVTAEIAKRLGKLVRERIDDTPDQERDRERERITKLVLECVFAMFAEDTELIPPKMFAQVLQEADRTGKMDAVWSLFDDFGRKAARNRGNAFAPYVNGPLFDQNHPKLPLSAVHIHVLYRAAHDFDWKDVRPEIFGSIFEQALYPEERHELGAHFTREADIARVVVPTIIEPWRARIQAVRNCDDMAQVIDDMKRFHVLDPASGCGNFLYVVYREMRRLEATLVDYWQRAQKATRRKADVRAPPERPYFTIRQLHGIERNEFAAFLSRVVLWMGEHLARREMGLEEETLPLKNLEANIRHADALFIDWYRPEGELAIVGNPPFLGVRNLRTAFGDDYVESIFERFPENRAADYVTYWFTRALDTLRRGERAGFVATNSIAQNESRKASIDKIVAKGGTITDAWESYPMSGETVVRVGIVNWVMAPYDGIKMLDGQEVGTIAPSLTNTVDLTTARNIPDNADLCFMGVTPGNSEFVVTEERRNEIVAQDPGSAKVIKPFLVGRDVNREVDQSPTRWIIDLGMMEKDEAEKFQGAMRHVRKYVYPVQSKNRRASRVEKWWKFAEPAPNLRRAINPLKMVIVVPCISPNLTISRQKADVCFGHQLMVVALGSYYDFGVLQSRTHESWAWASGSTLKGDLRYTNSTIFETFPFPPHPGGKYDPRKRPKTDQATGVAEAAEEFDKVRAATCEQQGVGLTKIHNQLKAGELPELMRAYEAMNDAVDACYSFPPGTWRNERETLRRLLELNQRLTEAIPT